MKQSIQLLIAGVVIIGLGFVFIKRANAPTQPSSTAHPSPSAQVLRNQNDIPLTQARERITKKHFGTYVTPQNSPVQPERFTGYHTGTDFETTPDEATANITVRVICTGPLLVKRFASGYGGVAVQSCTMSEQPVTVIYGHLKLSSITAPVGQSLEKGVSLGILGKGYSSETDGERKHLHLGIHRGTSINIKGYVSSSSELNNWIDPESVLFK